MVIAGLQGGKYGVVLQMHHSLVDGTGAMQVLSSLWDKQPVPAETPKDENFLCDPPPTPLALLRDALIENAARLYIHTPRYLAKSGMPIAKSALKVMADKVMPVQDRRTSEDGRRKLPKIRKTSLNVHQVSGTRSIAYMEYPYTRPKPLSRVSAARLTTSLC
jgi:hypothetical protein